MRRRALLLATLSGLTGRALAQPRPREHNGPRPCVVVQSPLPAALATAIGPGAPVALVARSEGAFVASIDRSGALRLARTDDALEPVGELRELASRGAAFSMVSTRDGVAVAWVEDERALLLGRIDDANELQNVPRLLSATRATIARVLVARAGDDLAVAWSTGGAAEVYALRTDERAVPRGGAQGMGEGELFDLAWLPDRAELALNVASTDTRWVISLDARGRELNRAPWPQGARGPITVDGAAAMVRLGADGAPVLTRPGSPALPTESPPAGLSLGALEARDGHVFAVVNDARGERATLHRLDQTGAQVPPVLLRAQLAGPEAIAVRPNGELLAVLREGRRLFVARTRCPR